jgi:type I restriction enzyme R subunit
MYKLSVFIDISINITIKKQKAFDNFTKDEKVNPDKLKKLTENYLFTQRTPKKEDVIQILE